MMMMMMMMAVCRLVLLSCIASSMLATDAAVVDDQSWTALERLDACSDAESPSVGDTCALCPAALPGVSMWRCCHDPRVFDDCAAAVDSADKRGTKYFLGKKRGVKYFLGKRSFGGDRGGYAALQPSNSQNGAVDKRIKYFLG